MYIVHLFYYFTSLFRRRAANRPPSSRIFSFAARRLLFSRMFPSAARRLPSSRIFRPLLDAHYLAEYFRSLPAFQCFWPAAVPYHLFPNTNYLILRNSSYSFINFSLNTASACLLQYFTVG